MDDPTPEEVAQDLKIYWHEDIRAGVCPPDTTFEAWVDVVFDWVLGEGSKNDL